MLLPAATRSQCFSPPSRPRSVHRVRIPLPQRAPPSPRRPPCPTPRISPLTSLRLRRPRSLTRPPSPRRPLHRAYVDRLTSLLHWPVSPPWRHLELLAVHNGRTATADADPGGAAGAPVAVVISGVPHPARGPQQGVRPHYLLCTYASLCALSKCLTLYTAAHLRVPTCTRHCLRRGACRRRRSPRSSSSSSRRSFPRSSNNRSLRLSGAVS